MSGANTTASDLTIFISQSPTARKLLPLQIKFAYNTVLFSEERIDEISAQIISVLKDVTQVGRRAGSVVSVGGGGVGRGADRV